jgi:hypothetical protein
MLGLRVWGNVPNGIDFHLSIYIYIFLLTNDAQELMLYRYQFQLDTKRIKKIVYAKISAQVLHSQ